VSAETTIAAPPAPAGPPAGADYRTGVLSHGIATELGRLRLLESQLDPATREVIGARDPRPDWHVLEVGAGAGSIARWLGGLVPDGTVTAIDVETRFLASDARGGPRVIRGDVREHDFAAASFDLIHARTVLMHLPERESVIDRLVSWLRPGGWLVLEDLVVTPADSSPRPLVRQAFAAIEEAMAATIGTDMRWARSYPAPLGAAGLVELGLSARYYPVAGGSDIGRLWATTFEQSASFIVGQGLLGAQELAETAQLFADPGVIELGPSIIAAWGRRPVVGARP
jgi:SAM-dependent methyltransferase